MRILPVTNDKNLYKLVKLKVGFKVIAGVPRVLGLLVEKPLSLYTSTYDPNDRVNKLKSSLAALVTIVKGLSIVETLFDLGTQLILLIALYTTPTMIAFGI